MDQMRSQLAALQQQLADSSAEAAASSSAAKLAAQVDEIRERQDLQESQIATHDQAKVESDSKYAVKLTGLVLLNGFVNTKRVDNAATPSIVLYGAGSSGASIRQTILGLDARGPHLWGAHSYADIHFDFDGGSATNGHYGAGGQLRLRTAHAGLRWDHTELFFALDHPLINPNTPTSLTAVSVPALAWSGNLWAWNTEVGLTHDVQLSAKRRLRMQAALIDIADPPPVYDRSPASTSSAVYSSGTAEQSRWPGVETRVALVGSGQENTGLQIGVGGIFAPHRASGFSFDTWAGTVDYRLPLPGRMELTGNFYRGQALGGLGGGAYKDFVYRPDPDDPGNFYYLDVQDVGGWAQLKQRATGRLEFNEAFGIDSVPAESLRPYAGGYSAYYLNLARNRTYTGNVIYSPSAYLLFSLEYRHIQSSPVSARMYSGDVIGIATGYRF
jgi:hypothetical protein